MNNISIPISDLLDILLDGNPCGSIPLNIKLRDIFINADPSEEYIHIEDGGTGSSFFILWSKFGWENELKRREYFNIITKPFFDRKIEKPVTKEFLIAQIQACAMKGDLTKMAELQKQLARL